MNLFEFHAEVGGMDGTAHATIWARDKEHARELLIAEARRITAANYQEPLSDPELWRKFAKIQLAPKRKAGASISFPTRD